MAKGFFAAFRDRPPKSQDDLVNTPAIYGRRFNPTWAHTFERLFRLDPGAQAYSYTNLGLVEFSPIGAGTANRGFFHPLQPTPLFAAHGILTQGLGGLVNGQFIGQPLTDPNAPAVGG